MTHIIAGLSSKVKKIIIKIRPGKQGTVYEKLSGCVLDVAQYILYNIINCYFMPEILHLLTEIHLDNKKMKSQYCHNFIWSPFHLTL